MASSSYGEGRVNPRLAGAALFGLCVFSMAGCGPNIRSFTVDPRRACPDDTIHIGFSVNGQPRLEVTSTSGAEPETLTYTLIVDRHGKSRYARQAVVRFSSRQEWPLVFSTEPLGADSVSASDTLPPDNWNSTARLAGVSSPGAESCACRTEVG